MRNGIFLFSVDVEDIRFAMKDGRLYRERVPATTKRYLEWLKARDSICTFFITGDVAEAYPELVREIAAAGHEIGCHSFRHTPVDAQSPDGFRQDVEANIAALQKAGAANIRGFRAPMFSLTSQTLWAYDTLAGLGFAYSSSVWPAKNPFWGWPEFGPDPKRIGAVWEIPMTIARVATVPVSPAGGVFLRALPYVFIRRSVQKCTKTGRPLLGYGHPYDIDTEQERFMHPDIKDSRFYNFLMYYNRRSVFRRLDRILKAGLKILTYSEYVATLEA
jgi:polysaccharide deacetylase family protein (PEP-CTERM system associated)